MGFEEEATASSHSLSIPPPPSSSSEPLLIPNPKVQRSSQPKTVANIFIAIVGAGVLGLPYTFMRTGWLSGSLLLLLVAALSFHGMLLLLLSRRRLLLSSPKPLPYFGDVGFAVFGPIGRFAVDSMILLSQAGFCVGYLLFISTTLAHLALHSSFHFPKSVFVSIMLPFQLALNSIKSLTHLAPLSILADVADLAAMAVVMVQDALIYLHARPSLRAFTNLSSLAYAAGVAVYSFEGAGMVLPLESEAADKSQFPKILGISMFLISVIYTLFGLLGYFAFGDNTSDIITTNLGPGVITTLLQIGLCFNLFFTFPIMMNPVHEVMERRFADKQYSLWMRWATVLCVALVALLVPNFTDFLSLVGSSVCCLLGFVLPALFHLKVFKGEIGMWWVVSDVAIIVIGFVFAVTGTYSSLMEIFNSGKA